MLGELERRRLIRKKRVIRVRKKLKGTAEMPRLCVNKSNKNIYVQIIDDEAGKTIVGYGSMSKELKSGKSKEIAKKVGTKIAELAMQKEVERVVFDRGSSKYHGVIAELANAAREAGLKF